MRILVVVDMQGDFVDGVLGTKEAVEIVPRIQKLIRGMSYGDCIIFTRDTHHKNYFDTQEGRKLPIDHCTYGTLGWEVYGDLMTEAKKSDAGYCCVDKPTFGSFDLLTHLSDFIVTHPNEKNIIEFCGVCTDICVVTNALLCKTAFPENQVIIWEKACAGTTPENHDAAIRTMQSCQCDIMEEMPE